MTSSGLPPLEIFMLEWDDEKLAALATDEAQINLAQAEKLALDVVGGRKPALATGPASPIVATGPPSTTVELKVETVTTRIPAFFKEGAPVFFKAWNAPADALTPAQYPLHPLCDLFPPIEGPAFDELVASIKEDGQREPIVLLDSQILDGRNQMTTCPGATSISRSEACRY
jgi:hypothetical protein